MKEEPSRAPRQRPPETEAWKIIFSAFALSGSLVLAWTLFVLLTDPAARPARFGQHASDPAATQPRPAKP